MNDKITITVYRNGEIYEMVFWQAVPRVGDTLVLGTPETTCIVTSVLWYQGAGKQMVTLQTMDFVT